MSDAATIIPQMTTESAAPQSCAIHMEGWRPELVDWLWNDAAAHSLRAAFQDLAELLAGLVDRPGDTTLVIAVDFVEAVMRRDDSSVHYSTTRGSGMVGGRTMPRKDGKTDVLIDGNWLVDRDSYGRMIPKASGVELMRRSIQHEAQHVVMHQRGSGFEAYGREKIPGLIDVHLLDFASLILDEHRAEWGAIALSAHDYPSTYDVAEVLSALGTQLTAIDESYQQSQDVQALMEGTLIACQTFWVSLAYWAAEYRSPDSIASLPEEILRIPLWERYVGDSWPAISDAFCRVPVADLSTKPEKFHEAARSMAAALRASLQVIGFRYVEDDAGSEFRIDRYDFIS